MVLNFLSSLSPFISSPTFSSMPSFPSFSFFKFYFLPHQWEPHVGLLNVLLEAIHSHHRAKQTQQSAPGRCLSTPFLSIGVDWAHSNILHVREDVRPPLNSCGAWRKEKMILHSRLLVKHSTAQHSTLECLKVQLLHWVTNKWTHKYACSRCIFIGWAPEHKLPYTSITLFVSKSSVIT